MYKKNYFKFYCGQTGVQLLKMKFLILFCTVLKLVISENRSQPSQANKVSTEELP